MFIPLENNPDVFTSLVHDLGVSSELGFYDVYSLEDKDLLSSIPRPALALIFITPSAMYHAVREEDGITYEPKTVTYAKSGSQESVMWFQQTIGNACGLIALLHSVANEEVKGFIQKGSFLDRLLEQTSPLQYKERAATLYNSDELEEIHMRAARRGNTAAPPAEELPGYHFLAFVKGKDDHLWELEGSTDGPVDRGIMREGDDMLSDGALEQGVKRFLKFSEGNPNFSIVALAKKAVE